MTPDETRTIEQRLRAAVESAPSGLLMVDSAGRIVLVNHEIERLFGYPREELLGQSADLLVPEAARSQHQRFRDDFLANPTVRQMGEGRDLYGRRKDGSEVPLEIGLTPVVTEEGMFVLSSIVDISERQRAAARFRAAVESSPAGMVMVDDEGRIVLVNREIERMFGWGREELMDQSIELLVPERFRENHPTFRGEFFQSPHTRPMGQGRDLFGLRKDGTEIPVEIGLNPIETEDGLFVLSSIVDISERKREEEERERLEHQLREVQKMDAVGTLAGGIAHDFNNILGAVLGFAELLRDSVRGEEGRQDLDELITFVHRGRSLVQKIQAFGRHQDTERLPISLRGPVAEVESFLRSSTPPNIEITTNVHAEAPRVFADPSAIHQILMNLGTNGAQAMPRGGRLSITVEPVYLTDSRARAHPGLNEGPYVALSVEDSGEGMDDEVRARVFEPFFTTKPPGEGSGLGLSIVHGIVREHEGAVELESTPGSGTKVRLFLPAIDLDELDDLAETDIPVEGEGERILYVDDETGLSTVGKRRLERIGYDVVVASDGDEALEAYETTPDGFDAVITDYLMPSMNGLELASALRGIEPDLPIILLTGFVDNLPEERITATGIAEIVRKPATFEELAAAVARVLGKTTRGG